LIARHATPGDFESILEMAEKFWKVTPYSELAEFVMDDAMEWIGKSFESRLLVVAEKEGKAVGFGCGIKSPCFANKSLAVGAELAFWVEPDHRGAGDILLTALEDAAKKAGCKMWSMVCIMDLRGDIVGRWYRKRGYKLSEQTYTKRL